MAKWESDANAARHGIAVSPTTSLENLLVDYLASLGNCSSKHLQNSKSRLRRAIDANEWLHACDVNQFQLEAVVTKLTDPKTKRPISLRAQGHYLGAWKSFTRWLTNVRHAYQRDPLAAVKKPNFAADRRVQRRFLHPEEWQWLAKTRYALLYRTAIETGFRASEIRMLDAHSLRRDHLFLPARYTKNKQDARQYITPELRDS